MGILKFLFGKQTNIFDEKGNVHHDLGPEKWNRWNNRLKSNPDYDWRAHKGTQTKGSKAAAPPEKKADAKN